jgi:hypothetical protein
MSPSLPVVIAWRITADLCGAGSAPHVGWRICAARAGVSRIDTSPVVSDPPDPLRSEQPVCRWSHLKRFGGHVGFLYLRFEVCEFTYALAMGSYRSSPVQDCRTLASGLRHQSGVTVVKSIRLKRLQSVRHNNCLTRASRSSVVSGNGASARPRRVHRAVDAIVVCELRPFCGCVLESRRYSIYWPRSRSSP